MQYNEFDQYARHLIIPGKAVGLLRDIAVVLLVLCPCKCWKECMKRLEASYTVVGQPNS